MRPRVSIIVVTHNHRGFIADCVHALERAVPADASVRLMLVDNASSDGTGDLVRRELLASDGARTQGGLPAWFRQGRENLGFAGGNNLALAQALADGDEFAYLLNPDTEAEPGFLASALEAAAADASIAAVQSLLLRHPETDVVNTWGNAIHFLGFGYAAGDGTRLDAPGAAGALAGVRDVAYASGAGMLLRLAPLRTLGLFAERLFAYHEDLELGWRLRLAGHRVVVEPRSRVRHKYGFGKGTRKYYFLERNRFLVLLSCYRARTLILLLPALVAIEAGIWGFAIAGGWWREKARACAYLLDPRRWPVLLDERRRVQALRSLGDREVSALFTGEIVFPAVSPWLLTHVANPVFAAYWRVARGLMR